MIDPTTGKRADTMGFAIDRELEDIGDVVRELGGGWKVGYDVWRSSGWRFLILVATTPYWMRLRSPIAGCARDLEGLRDAAAAVCGELNDVKCLWTFHLKPEPLAVVSEEFLRDAAVEGTA